MVDSLNWPCSWSTSPLSCWTWSSRAPLSPSTRCCSDNMAWRITEQANTDTVMSILAPVSPAPKSGCSPVPPTDLSWSAASAQTTLACGSALWPMGMLCFNNVCFNRHIVIQYSPLPQGSPSPWTGGLTAESAPPLVPPSPQLPVSESRVLVWAFL